MITTPITPATRPSAEAWSLAERLWTLTDTLLWEASLKLLPGAVLTRRFLLTFTKPADIDPLFDVMHSLSLPAASRRELETALREACTLHLGVEGEGSSTLYKLYLEFPARECSIGRLVHLAHKWDPARPEHLSVGRYLDWSAPDAATLAGRVESLLDVREPSAELLAATARGLIAAATERVGATDLLLLAVTEEGNPRRSFDLCLYDAELPIASLRGPLGRLVDIVGLDKRAFAALLDALGPLPLGHLAGGIARDGRPFCTLFYGGGRLERPPTRG